MKPLTSTDAKSSFEKLLQSPVSQCVAVITVDIRLAGGGNAATDLEIQSAKSYIVGELTLVLLRWEISAYNNFPPRF